MNDSLKDTSLLLKKIGIKELNNMQEKAKQAISEHTNVILLSPTGSGKTLAFTIPLLNQLNSIDDIQAIIIAPTRELVIQIEQVIRELGSGHKITSVYGGTLFSKDKLKLKHPPSILLATPGRLADHLRKGTLNVSTTKFLIMDEFDKALEFGFESEMKEITSLLPASINKILTSATNIDALPKFLNLESPTIVNNLDSDKPNLTVKFISSPEKDKLKTLKRSLFHLNSEPTIVFCNFKDTIERISDYLYDNNIKHACFYGGMEQLDRERALIKFRNGTHNLLIATDLAARGIDVPEIKHIIHYQLPNKKEEFLHRNGRTARMNQNGNSYILKSPQEELPYFIENIEEEILSNNELRSKSIWETIYISGGRKDKISKGDIAGLFLKKANLNIEEVGNIELKDDCAFIAVHSEKAKSVVKQFNNYKLKKKKVRLSII